MTCAKLVVTAVLTTLDGTSFVARNDCRAPQPVCPRAPGEGYDKCERVCHQLGHAEDMAIWMARRAGKDVRGAKMVVDHPEYVCEGCRKLCERYGVEVELKR